MRDIARALPVAADAHLAARAIAGGIDHGVIEINLKPGDFDRAASGRLWLGGFRAGRDLARDLHLAAIAATKRDLAIAARNRARLGNAGKIDGIAGRRPRRRRLHHDHAAFGRHRAGVFNQRLAVINQRRGNRHLHEAVAGEIERDLLAGAKPGLAIGHGDQPTVLHLAAHQRGIAAAPDRHHALVGNRAGRAIAAEHHIAGHEVVVGDIERRGDETAASFYRARRRDRDAIGVDEKDLAIAGKRPRDRGLRIAGNAVEDRRIDARLDEIDAVGLADIEALPVDDRPVGALRYRHRAAD